MRPSNIVLTHPFKLFAQCISQHSLSTHPLTQPSQYASSPPTFYTHHRESGGASGELLIRHCLENAFKELNVHLDVKTSDAAFESAKAQEYDIIIMDPWTW